MTWRLQAQRDAAESLAEAVAAGRASSFALEVNEDYCFRGDNWLRLADVHLRVAPGPLKSQARNAVLYGGYEIAFRPSEEVTAECDVLLNGPREEEAKGGGASKSRGNGRPKGQERVKAALKGVAHAAARCGLLYPILDAGSLSEIPPRRPTSMVTDTSSIVQGTASFATASFGRHLRVKVPAIAHMELLNAADNYFGARRKASNSRTTAFDERIRSQGGQRVLIRLELASDLEIDRPRVGADPLRGIVSTDSDTEDSNLRVSTVIRSFADRLIVESALRHREQMSPGHDLLVLTGDQGMARMCIAEGLVPLFFRPFNLDDIFGRTIGGVVLQPFGTTRADATLRTVPLTEFLWDLAVTFGSARLRTEHGVSFTYSAIGSSLPWMPYHSMEDLLWAKSEELEPPVHAADPSAPPGVDHRGDDEGSSRGAAQTLPAEPHRVASAAPQTPDKREMTKTVAAPAQSEAKGKGSTIPVTAPSHVAPEGEGGRRSASFRVLFAKVLLLLDRLVHARSVSIDAGMKLVSVQLERGYNDYKGFLTAGGFAASQGKALVPTEAGEELWAALVARDLDRVEPLLRRVPSFDNFIGALKVGAPVVSDSVAAGVQERAFTSYATIAELIGAGFRIQAGGVLGTPARPSTEEFARSALSVYESLARADEWVLCGEWLEALVRDFGVHPLRSRQLLEDARRAGVLRRFSEGSTPPTTGPSRQMAVLQVEAGVPTITSVDIYAGSFLLLDRASVRLRLERP